MENSKLNQQQEFPLDLSLNSGRSEDRRDRRPTRRQHNTSNDRSNYMVGDRFASNLDFSHQSWLPLHPDPQSTDWDRIVQLFSSISNEGNRIITVYVPGNSSLFLVQLKHLVPVCSWTSFLATNTQ
ncbi:hypothetical protein ALC57_02562 [Trachymyrmex cornetzi]|uniref:Uncharacterized protein n=1 Tax=Trachymyrmex cornetzi TaxID=471704 RepID=A0A151JNY0_9HYME|nr:hypothetical protein ALC57_02562 [Trachymyrmex cornetzi]